MGGTDRMTLAEEIRLFMSAAPISPAYERDTAYSLLERAAEELEAIEQEAAAELSFQKTAYLLSAPPRGNA